MKLTSLIQASLRRLAPNAQKTKWLGILGLALLATSATAASLGTSFTYQGRLNGPGGAASGIYDFTFQFFPDPSGGVAASPLYTNTAVVVSNGLFTTLVDVGSIPRAHGDFWLELGVRTNGPGEPAFTVLSPRQPITSTPFAWFADMASNAVTATTASTATTALMASGIVPGVVDALSTPGGALTNAVQVDTNGLVGIGTTTPQAGLDIQASGSILAPTVLSVVQYGANLISLGNASSVAVCGNLAAVGGQSPGGVTLLDLSNPQYPVLKSHFENGTGGFTNLGGVQGVALTNNLLTVAAASDSAVSIFSVTNPASPIRLAELRDGVGPWNYLAGADAVAISGNLLAVAAGYDNAVTLADISNPASPALRSVMIQGQYGFTKLNFPVAVAFSGSLLAVAAQSSSAVTLVDVSDPSSPVKKAELVDGLGGYTNLSGITAIALSGNLLAIAAGNSSAVTLVDVSNPSAPVCKSVIRNGVGGVTSLEWAAGVALSGNRLAVSSEMPSRVTLFDISDPTRPQMLAAATDGFAGADSLSYPMGVTFAGTNIAVASYNSSSFTLLAFGPMPVGLLSEGWIGIGTQFPIAALDVVGDVAVEQAQRFTVSASHVALGQSAKASGDSATAMGAGTTASGMASTAMGGYTTASGNYSTAMGAQTTASGAGSLAAGTRAKALHDGVFVWADSQAGDFASTSSDQFLVRAASGVGINTNNPSGAALSVAGLMRATTFQGDGSGLANITAARVTGTYSNSVTFNNAANVFAGSYTGNGSGLTTLNASQLTSGTVPDARLVGTYSGTLTFNNGANSFIGSYSGNGSGLTTLNASQLTSGTVPDARLAANVVRTNQAWLQAGNSGTSGMQFLGTTDNQALDLRVNNSRALRLEPGSISGYPNVIGGSFANAIATYGSTIAGGYQNIIETNASSSFIGGGGMNTIQSNATFSAICGGTLNTIQTNASCSFIGSGNGNGIQSNALYSAIAGGFYNSIQSGASESAIGGGIFNTNSGLYAVIPGGYRNLATGQGSFAAGQFAVATNAGAFVWGDSSGSPVSSTNNNSWTVRASGGVRFFSNNALSAGVFLAPGGAAWATISDRNAKKNFAPVDGEAVLDSLARMPVQQWNYLWEADDSTPHLGPMAQDFKAAFYPGTDDKSITTLEYDGVELAAIQGLNQKLEKQAKEKDAEIQALKRRNDSLERRLNMLEHMIQSFVEKN